MYLSFSKISQEIDEWDSRSSLNTRSISYKYDIVLETKQLSEPYNVEQNKYVNSNIF